MCVICIKERGRMFPSKSSIRNCVEANPDGFAMMWNECGVVCTYRTLDSDEFLREYDRIVKSYDHRTTSLVIHARIKTHGSLRLENCHCWTDEANHIGFAHNGILSVSARGDLTDSETFFRDIFLPVWEYSGHDWEVSARAVDAVIGASKFAFLEGDGTIHRFGHYLEGGGNLFSNTSFERKVYYTSYNQSTGYPYSGKWENSDWMRGKKTERPKSGCIVVDGVAIERGDISKGRWRLMRDYYGGRIDEATYIDRVVRMPRAIAGSLEWSLDEGSIDVHGHNVYATSFNSRWDWELYVMYIMRHITYNDYYALMVG